MPIAMNCCHVKHKGETWTLDLVDDKAEVRDAGGQVRASFTLQEAAGQFQLPSFSDSVKQFRVPVDSELWYFDVAKPDLKEIKAYIDRAVVAAGPEAIEAVRTAALRDFLIGAGCAVLGVGITVAGYMQAAHQEEGGKFKITYGLVIFGLVMLGKDAYRFMRYGNLRKMAQT